MRIAESKARETEAEARIAEAQASIEKAKTELAKIEKDKLQAKASIAESEAAAEQARADAISAASDKGNQDASPNSNPLNADEQKLANTWEYVGAIEQSTGLYYFEGAGRILFINNDRSFSEGTSSGFWTANKDDFYIDGFSIPYVLEQNRLVLGFDISVELYYMVYELL